MPRTGLKTKKTKRDEIEPLVGEQIQKFLSTELSFDSAGFLESIIEHWGGVAALAADLRQDYIAAKPGSMPRQRIIELISRLTIAVTNQGAATPKDPSNLSDEELVDEADRILSAIADRKKKAESRRPDEFAEFFEDRDDA